MFPDRAIRNTPWLALMAGLVFIHGSHDVSRCQEGDDKIVAIEIDDPRPVAEAVKAIQARYGVVITYEDPLLLCPCDVTDVTADVHRATIPPQRRIWSPAVGRFDFRYEFPAGGSRDMMALLRSLVAQYHSTGYPGEFRVVKEGSTFHVVPMAVRDRGGVRVPYLSPLDSRVSLDDGTKSALSAVEGLLGTVGARTGEQIQLGTIPERLLANAEVQIGADNERARTVLLRILGATGMRLSWRLLRDAGEGGASVLNIHVVPNR